MGSQDPTPVADATTSTAPSTPSVGLAVQHLFFHVDPSCDRDAIHAAIDRAIEEGAQVLTAVLLGHKADLGVMALS